MKKGKNTRSAPIPVTAELVTGSGEDKYADLPEHERQAYHCRDRINEARRQANIAFYNLSVSLLEAYENNYAFVYGFENFAAYVEQSLDMKYRAAYYMVEIARVVRKYGINQDQVDRIGWTKMREITNIITQTPDQADRYLQMAESLSASQLREELSKEITVTAPSGPKPETLRLAAKIEGEAVAIVQDGLAMAYGDIGKEDTSLALAHIFGEWLMARGAAPSACLEDWLDHLQKVFGVRLVRAEDAESIDALMSGYHGSQAADEQALDDLLRATEADITEMVN